MARFCRPTLTSPGRDPEPKGAGCGRPQVQKRLSRFPVVIKTSSRFRLGGPP